MKNATGTALLIAIFSSIFCILVILCTSSFIPSIFAVEKIGLIYLYIRLIGVIPNTILTILSGYQRTLGNSRILRAMKEFKYISKLSLWISALLKLILAFFFSRILEIYGIWLGFIIYDTIMNILINKRMNKFENN